MSLSSWIPPWAGTIASVCVGTALVQLLPGMAVSYALWPAARLGFRDRIFYGWGVGIALPPLMLYWA
jgi:hypothetical protein